MRNIKVIDDPHSARFYNIRDGYMDLFKRFAEILPVVHSAELRKNPGNEYRALRKNLKELENDINQFRNDLLNTVGKKIVAEADKNQLID